MMSYRQKKGWLGVVLAGLFVASGGAMARAAEITAAAAGHGRGASGFLAGLDRSVGLTPEQRDAVHGLLAEQRRQSQALREQTDQKIRAVLTPDQQKKFDTFVS